MVNKKKEQSNRYYRDVDINYVDIDRQSNKKLKLKVNKFYH